MQFTAATDGTAVPVDRDCSLVGVSAGINAVVSADSATTIANTITAPAKQILDNILAVVKPGTTTATVQMNIPVFSGSTLFVSCGSAGTVMLYFEP